jgi:hypothetical protein
MLTNSNSKMHNRTMKVASIVWSPAVTLHGAGRRLEQYPCSDKINFVSGGIVRHGYLRLEGIKLTDRRHTQN